MYETESKFPTSTATCDENQGNCGGSTYVKSTTVVLQCLYIHRYNRLHRRTVSKLLHMKFNNK